MYKIKYRYHAKENISMKPKTQNEKWEKVDIMKEWKEGKGADPVKTFYCNSLRTFGFLK